MSKICLFLTLFGKIKFSRKFLNLQYSDLIAYHIRWSPNPVSSGITLFTENLEILARILFSRIALKDIFVTIEICD